jgi:hypothetical protein
MAKNYDQLKELQGDAFFARKVLFLHANTFLAGT